MREKHCKILFTQSLKRSRKKGFDFNITEKYLLRLWDKQGGKCALTDITFHDTFMVGKNDRRPFIPSLDRINRKKGYVKGNVRVVCVAVNMALFTWGDEVFNEVSMRRVAKLNEAKRAYEENEIKKAKAVEEVAKMTKEAEERDLLKNAVKVEHKPTTLIGRGHAETMFSLCQGWFCRREREALPVPLPEKQIKRGKNIIWYKYSPASISNFFKEHPGTQNWCADQ